jgi:chromosome segregation ATPase
MASLNALTEEAGAVVAQQEEAGEAQQQLAAALQEVKERKDKKQEEVRGFKAAPLCNWLQLLGSRVPNIVGFWT